jgi:hypothetical protein
MKRIAFVFALRGLGWTAALATIDRVASAQLSVSAAEEPTDPYALPDAPAPPTLPDLTHRALAVSVENTFASIRANPRSDGTTPDRSFGWNERFEVEQALSIRRWYAGASEQIAYGKPSGRSFLTVAGNPELWGRALWASPAGLAYGGGLGLVLPVSSHGAAATEVAQTIRVLRPWDYVDFINDTFIFRPFIDVRDIDGRVIVQLRQGIDWDPSGTAITSRTTFYAGYRVSDLFGVGLEAWEVYLIKAPESKDDGRAAYAVSPSVRLMTRVLKPAMSVLLPIDRPLFDAVEGFWAIRLSFEIVVDPLLSEAR